MPFLCNRSPSCLPALVEILPFIISLILNGGPFGLVLHFAHNRRNSNSPRFTSGPGLPLDLIVCNYAVAAIARSALYSGMASAIAAYGMQNVPMSPLTMHQLCERRRRPARCITRIFLCRFELAYPVLFLETTAHYRQLATPRRSIGVCLCTWIQASLEPIISEAAGNGGWLLTSVLFEVIPVIFSLVAEVIVTVIVYRHNRFDGKNSKRREQPIWKIILRTFQGPMTATVFFCPAIISNVAFALYQLTHYQQGVPRTTENAILILCTRALSNYYLCGILVIIVAMHPMYWRHPKEVIHLDRA